MRASYIVVYTLATINYPPRLFEMVSFWKLMNGLFLYAGTLSTITRMDIPVQLVVSQQRTDTCLAYTVEA